MHVSRAVTALAAVAVLIATGVTWNYHRTIATGFTHSDALEGTPTSVGKDMNLLIMGLDSRLDEKGEALPADIYNALHAGDGTVGGYNANVLIVLHIPGDGSKATAISIPRDDYVDLAGCASPCKGKIKEAYGYAFARRKDKLIAAGIKDQHELEQKSRDAGRRAQIDTVRKFLGGIPIDHFVEVTLVAFFQLAQVVQPLEVCVNQDTSDSYSGARFKKGVQHINAKQAVAFVRQRRDPNEDLMFTDMDRDRRQQAFLISLSKKLNETGTFTNVRKLQGILDVAQDNIAIDYSRDIDSFAKMARKLTGGNVTFYTLPIERFGRTDEGSDINVVDTDTIHAIVKKLIGPDAADRSGGKTPTTPAFPTAVPDAAGITLDVVNGSGRSGIAGQLETALSQRGFTRGKATTGRTRSESTLEYGPGAGGVARQLGTLLSITDPIPDNDMPDGSVRLTVGTDFTPPAQLISQSETTTTTTTIPKPVNAGGVGTDAPAPTDLTALGSAGGVPCVK